MGKKDSKNALNSSPIENHRRQIGKQEMKRAKKGNKIIKKNIEMKRSAMTIQEIILVVGALIGVLAGIYFLFAYQMGTQWTPSSEKEGLYYRNISSDQRVPELFYQEFENELLFKRSERPISRIRPNSVLNSLLHSIRSYPLLGRLKPCFYSREHLITSVSRRSRTLDERRAKSFLSSCIRSVLADIATIRIDDDIESSLKYGQLMDETILQVMILNPMLDREQDKWIVRDTIFQHVNYQIGAARRRQRQNSVPEYSTTSPACDNIIEDDEDFQVVPDIDVES